MLKIIIHICGASGSGKTFLGNQLKEKFGKKIVVKDLDELRDEHIKKTYDTSKGWSIDEVKYQKYIDDFVNKQKKPIIFVGTGQRYEDLLEFKPEFIIDRIL